MLAAHFNRTMCPSYTWPWAAGLDCRYRLESHQCEPVFHSHLPLPCLCCRLWTKNPVQRSWRSLKTQLKDSTWKGPAPRMAPGLETGTEPGPWLWHLIRMRNGPVESLSPYGGCRACLHLLVSGGTPAAWDLQSPQGSAVRADSGSFLRVHLSTCFLLNTYYMPGIVRDKVNDQDRTLPGELRCPFGWLPMLLRHSLHFWVLALSPSTVPATHKLSTLHSAHPESGFSRCPLLLGNRGDR